MPTAANPRYQLQPLFQVRLTGVVFDILERLATPDAARAARAVLEREVAVEQTISAVLAALSRSGGQLDRKPRDQLRKLLKRRAEIPDALAALAPEDAGRYSTALARHAEVERELATILPVAYAEARAELRKIALDVLPSFAVFSSDELFSRIEEIAASPGAAPPTSDARRLERHLALCLQRLCAKNDTVSQFGPTSWGRVDASVSGVELDPVPGIARRTGYLEKWLVVAVVAAMNADAEVRAELTPRVHPNGRWENLVFLREDTGETIELDSELTAVARACDGQTPAHRLGIERVIALADLGVVLCEVELPWMVTDRIERLIEDVESWRDGPVRARWLPRLRELGALPGEFVQTLGAHDRRRLMARARDAVAALGAPNASLPRGRGLYEAANPIGEDCHRDTGIVVGAAAAEDLVRDAAPWLDFWSDAFALAASQAFATLRDLHDSAPRRDGRVRLPAFLRYCEQNGVPLGRTGPASLVDGAFTQVKEAFRAATEHRTDAPEWELTEDECHCVRKRYQFPALENHFWPNVDLQIAASSAEATARGDYQWVLAELHGNVTLLQHLFYWSCPDPAAFADMFGPVLGGPLPSFGETMLDLATHVTVRMFDALPEQAVFCGPQRPAKGWRTVAPAAVEVVLDREQHDVRLREVDSGRDLGSMVRHQLLFFGLHPFLVPREGHSPRLKLGRVVVQRETWHVTAEELGGPYEGVSPALVVAVERLRARRNLPRHVYIRPADLHGRGVRTARDKDVKPIYIDLESYTFLEIFAQWLRKFGRIEVAEMLPDRDQLMWQEADGRRSFELRALIGPRRSGKVVP